MSGVWRWTATSAPDLADQEAHGRCGTAVESRDGVVLVDPAPLDAGAAADLIRWAGPIRHVVLTSQRLLGLARAFGAEVAIWVPGRAALPDGTQAYAPGDVLPGGLRPVPLQGAGGAALEDLADEGLADEGLAAAGAGDAGMVALRLDHPTDGTLLLTGDALRVVGQTPVYREGDWPSFEDYRAALQALLDAEPSVLLPAHQAAPDERVVRATGYAAQVGRPIHQRRAAPVAGPRLLVPDARRVLEEALLAPVVLRRAPGPAAGTAAGATRAAGAAAGERAAGAAAGEREARDAWNPDPFACSNCGRPNDPAIFTCGGPLIPRLCPECRADRRPRPAAFRVMVCGGGCCTRVGSRAVASEVRLAAAELGLTEQLDVAPVSCLGECSIGPLVGVAGGLGGEPAEGAAWRGASLPETRRRAAAEGETLDDESERVLARFAAFVGPSQARDLITRLAGAARNA